ncbi:DUF6934 family protein [Deminuibacter soli]|uniref:Uncharacterized protein n=1 Tax=Deminuibacter soli TaxID=2291815 RepID=A0A3E1NFZ8_9BACT|nr:hypothetical protein [Deminuibacter soli]RFM26807.1 hypothetical protein DXN05_17615 [Deminuibacter soli]
MALNIKINFEEKYTAQPVDKLNYSTFEAELKNGEKVTLGITISMDEHPFMPDVLNLSFGPVDANDQIDDEVKLPHRHHSKVFSTVVFEGLSFLNKHPKKYLGIDGSTMSRAYLYYRCIQNNFDYLHSYFDIYGVNYYVRYFRSHEDQPEFEDGDILALPVVLEKGEAVTAPRLYNYFIFKAKQPQP